MKNQPPKKPKLTTRQKKLIKGIAEGKTDRQAALDAGYGTTIESAAAIASKTLTNVNVQEALAIALEKHGITLDAALAPIAKALVATKILISGQGDQAFAEVVEDIELQLKGSDRSLKLMNIGQGKDTNQSIHFHQHVESKKDEYGF